VKVAVLSLAHERAETYVRLLRDMPEVDLVAADPDHASVSLVDSWDAVFAARPDAVVVTGEVDRRRELVERAAEAGAHVLCEHPLAAKEADAKAMVDACDVAGVRLALASPACFGGAFAAVRNGIADGVVGTLSTIHGTCHSTPAAGGALAAAAPHVLDLADAVLDGEPAEQVYAQANSVLSGRTGVESAALVSVRYPSGTVVAIDCGWSRSPVHGPVVTFVGDRASVEYDACPRLLGGFDAATGGTRWEPGGADLYSLMLKDFLTGAGAGPDGAAGLRALRVVQAAYESVHTGQPVDIDAP
jgi:predicted dehydrogenase